MDPNIGAMDSYAFTPSSPWPNAGCTNYPFGYQQVQDVRNSMGGNGTAGHPAQQSLTSYSGLTQPISESAPQQLSHGSQQYLGSSMLGNGIMGLNHTQQPCALDFQQPSGSGLLRDICPPTAAANQPGKTGKRKTSAEASRDYREKKKAILNELTNENERLRKENEAAKRDLGVSKRKVRALRTQVQRLKAARARYKERVTQQQIQMQHLQGEVTRLRDQNAMLQAQNNCLMQELYG